MTNTKKLTTALALGLMLTLAACGKPSKSEIIEKAEGAETPAQLKELLGEPDNVSKFGPVATWTYEAKNGTVKFSITGDSVLLTRTGGEEEPEPAPAK